MAKTILYQLLPRLFGNTNESRIFNGSYEDNGCGKFNDINDRALKNIKDSGYTHVWYTGILNHSTTTAFDGIEASNANIVKGRVGSPYAIRDYYDVAPSLAVEVACRMDEFVALVERTHRAGLKCIIDFVPNHVARDYSSHCKPDGIVDFGFNDNREHQFSAQNNFYYLPGQSLTMPVESLDSHYVENPARVSGNDAFTSHPSINDWYETVKLNYGINYSTGERHFNPIPDTWLKMREILMFWASKGVDGFRTDMAEMVPLEFWHWVLAEVKGHHPHLEFVAEVYNLTLYRSFIHAGFDWLYDKEGFYNCLRSIMQGERKASDLCGILQMNGDIEEKLLLFLENHDEQRIASQFFMGDGCVAKPGMLVTALFNSKSALMIYCGQELGEPGMDKEGFSGGDGRTSIFDYWGVERIQQYVNHHQYDGGVLPQKAKELDRWYQTLLQTIQQYSSLQKGGFYDLTWYQQNPNEYNHQHIYSFLRYDRQSRFLILVNFGKQKESIRLRIPFSVFQAMGLTPDNTPEGIDVFSGEKIFSSTADTMSDGGVGIIVNAQSGYLIKL